MQRKKLLIGVVVILAAGVWYWFRPELLWISAKVHEEFPAGGLGAASPAGAESALLVRGSFHSVAHESKGVATVHQLPDGKRVLRFTEFKTSNGPALRVYLVAAADAKDSRAVKETDVIDLGPLKGNEGDQNYDLPAEASLGKYRSVTIWCQRFSVNFATAPLTASIP